MFPTSFFRRPNRIPIRTPIRRRQPARPLFIEPLEKREMLDAAGIVVGRTLSAYSVANLTSNELTIDYTVYNQEAELVSGVLLTTTLEPGLSIKSASNFPDRNGQELAWSLGDLNPFGRTSVSLTVTWTGTAPLQYDDGAEAFATSSARAVSDAAPAVQLRLDAIPAALLASTPDANTTDPFIQEKAASLDYDAQAIFDYLRTDVGYESYVGSLRGARGTLWSGAGNSLDEASLGVALMRASGIPARYVQGTLSEVLSRQLILSMFPASFQTVGFVPAGTEVADPANDSQLLSETRQHYWFQFDTGGGFQDADPLMAAATIGESFTTSTDRFTEVDDRLREKTEITLTAEVYNQASAALGGGDGISQSVVLHQVFSDVDLVGRPVTIGNHVTNTSAGSILVAKTNNYTPYIQLGDLAFPDPRQNEVISGTPYQEVLTNVPLGNQFLTGLFLNITLSGPNGASEHFQRTLVDRIGYAVRQGLTQPSLSVDPNGPPIISSTDLYTVNVLPGLQSAAPIGPLNDVLQQIQAAFSPLDSAAVSAGAPPIPALVTSLITALQESACARFLVESDRQAANFETLSDVVAYYDRPRITIFSDQLDQAEDKLQFAVDLRRETMRVYAVPGQNTVAAQSFNMVMGFTNNALESAFLPPMANGVNLGTANIFAEARSQDVPITVITSANLASVSSLNISADAKAYITTAIQNGFDVLVPTKEVTIRGKTAVSWYEIDPRTGVTRGVLENGIYSAILEEDVVLIEADVTAKEAFFNGRLFGEGVRDYVNRNPQLTRQEVKVLIRGFYSVFPELVASGYGIGFLVGLGDRVSNMAIGQDPSASGGLSGTLNGRTSTATLARPIASSLSGGPIAGTVSAESAAVSLSQGVVTWSSTSTGVFQIASFNSATAVITDSRGNAVGAGQVSLSTTSSLAAAISGNDYSVEGKGSLSFYGSAESGLGVSGNWDNYIATITGDVSITLTTDSLMLNGTLLPAGAYTITTHAATLTGSGATSSPNFAGSASITATSGVIEVGAETGSVSIGGNPLPTDTGFTLAGYNGTINVTADTGPGVDTVTLDGDAGQVLCIEGSPAAIIADQNTPGTFNFEVQTSFADTYTLSATAPEGWTVEIAENGQVTVTPAPGTQTGVFLVHLVARSQINPNLVAAADVTVTVNPTQPGLTFDVASDSTLTVPFANAQAPTAFQATMQNLGPDADTYDLTFPNPPAGFNILRSLDSVTVAAGETGIVGVYLEPNGQLPLPRAEVSFTVRATSRTNPAIFGEETFVFSMPQVLAYTTSIEPASLNTIPGAPANAMVTFNNVGNVPAHIATGATLPSGLTVTGLTTPVMLGVGQSTTQPISFTPAANTPLNSTVTATLTTGPEVSPNTVSVVEVRTDPSFAESGQTVNVSASIHAGVMQEQHASAFFVVESRQGATVFQSNPRPLTLSVFTSVINVTLGALDTVGFAPGEYTIEVRVHDAADQPIASGEGKLIVSLPIAASQDVSPGTLTEGRELAYVTSNARVTNTITVSSRPLVGAVDTSALALNVALSGNLAYVGGTRDITIVNIADPADPQIVKTFGADLVNQNADNFVQIVGNNLVVGSQNPANASTSRLLVFSLADPQNPQLVSNTTIPYRFLADVLVQGNTVFMPTSGIYFSQPGTITDQFGDFVAIDISIPASPVVSDVLFNNRGTPDGGDTRQSGGTIVNAQIAYIGSTTSTGSQAQSGEGRVLVVDIARPANLSVTHELLIPGTAQVFDVALEGHRALVVGSSQGLRNPFNGSNDLGAAGNLTLTMLDISDPANPQVLGSTKVTSAVFPRGRTPRKLEAVSLGGNRFAVSGVSIENEGPVIAIVDGSDPANITSRNLAVSSLANGMTVAGGLLHVASNAGLASYRIEVITSKAVHVELQVPTGSGAEIVADSFNLAPTQVASGAGFDTLTWDLTFDAAALTQELTWQTAITNMTPGTTRPVTLGAIIQVGDAGGSDDLTLPPLVVASVPATQSLQIPVHVVVPGADALADASLAAAETGNTDLADRLNDLAIAVTNLVQGPESDVARSQALAAIDSIITQLDADECLSEFSDPFQAALTELAAATTAAEVQAAVIRLGDAIEFLDRVLRDMARHGYRLSLPSNLVEAQPNSAARFEIFIENIGSETTTYVFEVTGLPPSVAAAFTQPSVTLAPGERIAGGVDGIQLLLTQTGNSLIDAGFTLRVIVQEAPDMDCPVATGALTVRPEVVSVAAVSVDPADIVVAGAQVNVTAKLLNAVNRDRPVTLRYTVKNDAGQTVSTSTDTSAQLTIQSALTTIDLGSFDTTGLANGAYTIEVVVFDAADQPITSGFGLMSIGSPVRATLRIEENLQFLPGTTVAASSAFAGFPASRVIDGNLNTSWFAAVGDAANRGTSPFLEVTLPVDATVRRLEMFGNRESHAGFDFFAGRFQLFDAAGVELFNTGIVTLPAPDRDIVIAIPEIAGVRRVRFTATADESGGPGFAELRILGNVDGSPGLPPGDHVVATTLEITAQTPFANPLEFRGLIDTTATGTSVAVQGTIAYVVGTDDISIVNVADPDNPVVVGVFADPEITNGTYNIGQVAGSYLVVASTATTNANFFRVFLFDISNPTSPVLVNPTTNQIGYRFVQDLFVVNDTLVVPTQGVFGSSSISDQFGDVVSVNIANKTAPVLADVLFNNRGVPSGGDFQHHGGAIVNTGLAYMATTTSRGSATQTGAGIVRLVDLSNPGALSEIEALQIPGTTHVVDIAIDGNRALVVGTQGGGQNPFNSANAGLTGKVTLTVLDITDPLNPQIISATVVTDAETVKGTQVNKLDALSLGNGLFAISNVKQNGLPVILLVDPSDPDNMIISSSQAATAVNGMAFVGNRLYATSASGLAIYDIGQLESRPVTASVQVPNNTGVSLVTGSFTIAPDEVKGGPDFDTLVWRRNLAFGNTSYRFTWQSTVDDLQPNELRDLTLETTVTFDDEGDNDSLQLPSASVNGQQIIGLAPSSATVRPGQDAAYDVIVVNPTNAAVTYTLGVVGVPAEWVSLATSVNVPARSTLVVPLQLTTDLFTAANLYGYSVTLTTGGVQSAALGTLNVAGAPLQTPELRAHGVVAELIPTQATVGRGTSAAFVVRLTNSGSVTERFALAANVPAGISATFEQMTVEIPPGASNFRDITLILTPQTGTALGDLAFDVVASSLSESNVSDTAAGVITVVANGVRVAFDRSQGLPGESFQATITNTGSVADVFDLAVAGPAGLVATLTSTLVSLAPNQSQAVTVASTAVDFAVPGSLNLTVIARSRGNRAVVGSDTADLEIRPTTGLTSRFDPAVKVLPTPGATGFLLFVQNTGNVEDAYTAVITSSTGPITASLNGLDGRPTQTIPIFRLPALSTGAILIDAILFDTGDGTVTVQITSLNNPALATSATATVTVRPSVEGTSEDDVIRVFPTPGDGDISYILNGAAPVSIANAEFFEFNGLGGNDTMIVVFPESGILVPGAVTFDGGIGTNTLVVDAQGQLTRVIPGVISGESQPVRFVNVQTTSLENARSVAAFYGPNTSDRETALTGLTASRRFVQTLYLNALGRAGNLSELDHWVGILNVTGSREQVARGIEHSLEGRNRMVLSWYQSYLGRSAGGNEHQPWVDALISGQTEERVLSGILGSAEFFTRSQTLVANGSSQERYVQSLYMLLLGRTGALTSVEVLGWVNGYPVGDHEGLALGILRAPEFRTYQVEALYVSLLHRPGDAPGRQLWVSSMIDVGSVRINFDSSDEFLANG